MPIRKKVLTAKDLGLAEDVKLSAKYTNTEKCFRTVSDQLLGYYIVPGRRNSPASIAPIYQADAWINRGSKDSRVIISYEIGQYLNGGIFESDDDGNALARIAADAIGALERHASLRAVQRSELTNKQRKR